MSRYQVLLTSTAARERVANLAAKAPSGTRVEFKAIKRTTPQNDRMWAMLTDVAMQLPWHGVKLRPDDWKFIFLDALKRELRMVPNIDGTGFVNLGRSSSDLSKSEMSDLIEIIHAFGANHSVTFNDTDSNSVEPVQPPASQPTPAAIDSPDAAGDNSSPPSPSDESSADGEPSQAPSALPAGWEIALTDILRRKPR